MKYIEMTKTMKIKKVIKMVTMKVMEMDMF